MTYSTEMTQISLPIAPSLRRKAEQMAAQFSNPEKSEQVLLNLLAVHVVDTYLQMMGLQPEMAASLCWNPVGQLGADIADLKLRGLGRLECRPVRSGQQHCRIPSEVQHDRMAYIIVEISEDHRQGTLLGFVPQVTTSLISLQRLQSLDYLLERCQPIRLSNWLNHTFEPWWQAIDEVLEPRAQVAFMTQTLRFQESTTDLVCRIQTTEDEEERWQAVEKLWAIDPNHPAAGVRRVQDLGLQLEGHAIALMVAILQKPNGEVSILTRVYPMSETHLPPDVQLTGLYETGDVFYEVRSRTSPLDNYIQFKFTAEVGESFGVQVSLGDASIPAYFTTV